MMLLTITFLIFAANALGFTKHTAFIPRALSMTSSAQKQIIDIPLGAVGDFIVPEDSGTCAFDESEDIGAVLKTVKKGVIFGVPGAFTPTCSEQHLPGFIKNIGLLREKGVEKVYCLSVNDRFVMRAWAASTSGCIESGIQLVADGNGDFATALGVSRNARPSKMGIRSKRFAAIIEDGVITHLAVDEKGMVNSSAEAVLALL
jgi:alkyl hydroperoxide reductase subunit AhpC